MTLTIKPVVLCGGSGTRLWPLSTPDHPKQFLKLLGNTSMLEVTLDRVKASSEADLDFCRPLVIGAARHANLIHDLAPDADVLLEPAGKNSAPPVAAAALAADRDEVLLVLPADHDIADVPAFHQALIHGARTAREGAIVTFGIIASSPATGYGYIEAASKSGAVIDVVRFVEKPDLETAKTYIASGNFFWNAGIFLFRAGEMIDAFEAHAPDIMASVRAAMPDGFAQGGGVSHSQFDADIFDGCRSESVDYAIIEHQETLKVVPVEMGWSDIGDFKALWERSEKDENGNVAIGDVRIVDSRNCYVRAEGKALSVSGQENTVIVSTADEVLVCNMSAVQSVKAVAKK